MTKDYGNYVYVASSPGPAQKLGNICALSAVFLWSRGIRDHIHPLPILDVKIVDLFQDHLKWEQG